MKSQSSLFERLQTLRARFAKLFRSEGPGRRAILTLETVEDRAVPALVSGIAWADTNGNGVPDTDEGVAGVQITLTPGSGTSYAATTDSNGDFSLTGVASGSYSVAISAPAGYTT